MRKLSVLLFVLCFAIILAGCDSSGSDESINAQNDIVVINFDSHSAKGMSLNTQYPEVTELYWSYTAEKKDNKSKYGEKLAPANIKDGTGCDKNIEFSTGKWEFVLYGFTTAEARTKSNTVELAEKNCTYTGKVEKELKKTDTAVTVYTEVNSNPDTYGTIKVSVTTSPTNSNKTVKYYITNANGYSTTWTSVPGQENTTATDGYTVYLGLFDETGKYVGETLITDIKVDAGLTTEISGTWDVEIDEASSFEVQRPVSVKFKTMCSTLIQNRIIEYGTSITTPSSFTIGELYEVQGKKVCIFCGWTADSNALPTSVDYDFSEPITTDTTLYAKWNEVNIVSFDVQGHGTVPNFQIVTNGGEVTKPADPTTTGFVFKGWYKETACINEWNFDTDTVTSSITLYAKWVPRVEVYTITYKDKGGADFSGNNLDSLPQTHTYNSATNLIPATTTTSGVVFAGWYKNSDCSDTPVTSIGATEYTTNLTLYAKWEKITITAYKITKSGSEYSYYGTCDTSPTSLSDFSISATQAKAESAIGTASPVFGEAGGYVFYKLTSGIDGYNGQYTGCSYLEASAEDVGSYPFGYYRLSNNGDNLFVNKTIRYDEADCTGTKIGTGKRNTTSLTDVMGDTAYLNPTGSDKVMYAAKVCSDYSSGAYNDWFLPSIDELGQMYINLCSKNVGNFTSGDYWSSSEYPVYLSPNPAWAWAFSFVNNSSSVPRSKLQLSVRACRAF